MIKEALDEYALASNRSWGHDRSKTVGASEIGQCARKVYYTKKGMPPEEDQKLSYGAHVRGTIMENHFWEPAMQRKFGTDFKLSGRFQKTFKRDYLSATPDGLLTNLSYGALKYLGVKDISSDCILVECKSIDPRVDLRKEKEEHHFQVQVQLGLVRDLTTYYPMYAVISYMDASFWHEIDEYAVKFDPDTYAQAHQRAREILTAESPSQLKPEGWIAGGKECEWCVFTKACGVVRKSVPQQEFTTDPQFTAEISDLAREYLQKKKVSEQVENDLRSIQEGIKERLRQKGVRKVPGIVSWNSQKGRTSYDYKALCEAAEKLGLDTQEFATTGEPTDRLTVLLKDA